MQQADLLKKLFESYQQGDDTKFRLAAEQIIEQERKKRRTAVASDLERILASAPAAVDTGRKSQMPAPGTVEAVRLSLVDEQRPPRHLSDLVLSPVAAGLLERVIRDFRESQVLEKQGLRPKHRVLFCGPPGCGKTATAEAVAGELRIPLLNVRLTAVMSSSLGETTKNLTAVFDYAAKKPSVILFDEFDSIGRSRDDVTERGEIKRVLNSFVHILDRFSGASLLIAATNFEQVLDPAIWRRFHEVIRFEKPREAQVEELVRRNLAPLKVTEQQVEDLVRNSSGSTHEEVENLCLDVRKSCLLRSKKTIESQDLREAIARRVYRQSILQRIAKAAAANVDRD